MSKLNPAAGSFQHIYHTALEKVMEDGEEVEVGQWQSQDISDNPDMISRELRHMSIYYPFATDDLHELQQDVKPNLPWAEDHFGERVSGVPYNPPPSEAWWPFRVQGNAAHKEGHIFSHTYPERMWPRTANLPPQFELGNHWGIRYGYGDLNDVVDQLTKNPLTRQAYLPIWFPEDTGAVHSQRVPCTLGYHFLIRPDPANGPQSPLKADIIYHIRSCDMLRHFPDDVYMACRLLQWVVGKLRDRSVDVAARQLIMHIGSFHIFRGDYERVRLMLKNYWRDSDDDDIYGAAV